MNRLSSELCRLYAPTAVAEAAGEANFPLIGADGQVRALVLELGRPADWAAVAAVWQGVQAELGLPAPAIVVQGVDAYQLWFSLAQPLPAHQGHGLLQALAARYLGGVAPHRLRLLPATGSAQHAALVPQQVADERWSAFVSADLAPMFTETPWLDLAPNLDGQAGLLATLQCIQPDAVQEALVRLRPSPVAIADAPQHSVADRWAMAGQHDDPRRFLQRVMNDETVALALRVEAAKALLA